MADILKYRIPGKEKIEQSGTFMVIENVKNSTGFLMTSFLKDKLVEFVPSGNPKMKPFFLSEPPFVIEKSEYLGAATSFLNAFDAFEIKKAVFSRIKEVSFDETKLDLFFDSLCENYPSAFVYLATGEEIGTWIGASPETLLTVVGQIGFTMSLAATKSLEEKGTVWGNKEVKEQQYVTDFIQEQLRICGVKDVELNGPYDVEAGPVMHLRTDISFERGKLAPIEIAKKLHPTPAISGFPQKAAIDLINFREAHERDFYAGMIGLVSNDSASLYINLRCCQIQKGKAFLYLGGGFTSDSNVELEWEETENKSRTLLNIIETL
jgi:isochorismate synthase